MAGQSRRYLAPPAPVQLRRTSSASAELTAIQDATEAATKLARAMPDVKGREVVVRVAATGPLRVAHGLGRRPLGYREIARDGEATYSSGTFTTRHLTLIVNALPTPPVEIRMWVY